MYIFWHIPDPSLILTLTTKHWRSSLYTLNSLRKHDNVCQHVHHLVQSRSLVDPLEHVIQEVCGSNLLTGPPDSLVPPVQQSRQCPCCLRYINRLDFTVVWQLARLQSSQLAEPLWIDRDLKSGTSAALISDLKKKCAGGEWSEFFFYKIFIGDEKATTTAQSILPLQKIK